MIESKFLHKAHNCKNVKTNRCSSEILRRETATDENVPIELSIEAVAGL